MLQTGKYLIQGIERIGDCLLYTSYQYGMRFYGKATPEGIADEKGKYKYEFTLPQEWEGKQIELCLLYTSSMAVISVISLILKPSV